MTFATKVVKQKGKNELITGTGTAGQAGSSSDAYVPTLWKFNLGMTPVAGDVITVKIPYAGVNAGVWMSVDNGSNYYPVALSQTGRLTTEYSVDSAVELVFETGLTTAVYGTDETGAAAGSSTTNWTGGRWSVLNFRDTNTQTGVNQTAALANTNTNKYTLLHAQNTGTSARNGYAVYKSKVTYQPSTENIFIHDKPALYGTYSATTPASPVAGQIWLNATGMSITEAKVLILTGTLSSLPTTISDTRITEDMAAINLIVNIPRRQNGNWTVTTSNGSLTISGSLVDSVDYTLYLLRSR